MTCIPRDAIGSHHSVGDATLLILLGMTGLLMTGLWWDLPLTGGGEDGLVGTVVILLVGDLMGGAFCTWGASHGGCAC